MPRPKKPDYADVTVTYRTHSGLAGLENHRYQQHIVGEVIMEYNFGEKTEKIGEIVGDKLLLDYACEDGWGVEPVFDIEGHLYEIGNIIYNYRKDDYKEEIRAAFGDDLIDRDVLVLTRIELLPKFRRAKIGRYLIKDFYKNFIGGCGLMVLKCFPLQLAYREDRTDGLSAQMEYNKFEMDTEKAIYSLRHFYINMGFTYLPEISDDLMFLCPAYVNKKLDKIILD